MKKILLICAMLCITAKILLTAAIFFYPKIISGEEDFLAISASRLTEMTNNYRQENGLNPLKINYRLTQAALNKARDLLADQYFAHTSPEGKKFSDWVKEVNYKYFYVGENLAIDFNNENDLFQAWLDSPTHRENIIKPQFQEIGIAAVKGKFKEHPTMVVVQIFGSRVLGAEELPVAAPTPLDTIGNYFYRQTFWQKISSLENLEEANRWTSYLLMIFVGLCLIGHQIPKKISQINIKQPIINRYQAKIFKE